MKPIPFIIIGVTAMISISIMSGLQCKKPEIEIVEHQPKRVYTEITHSHNGSKCVIGTKDRQVITGQMEGRDTVIIYPKDSIEF